MGLFDKIKTFVGGGAPKITFTRVEDNIPVTDTGVKFNILVEGEKDLTITSATAELKAVYRDAEGEEQEEVLATEEDNGEHWSDDDNPFPGIISKDQNWEFAGSVFMDDDQSEVLQKLFAEKASNKLKLMLEVEIDVKEIGMMFDPSIKTEIKLS